jgi:serine/threonine protein kinase/CHASE2 domain-containing sensor protein
MLASLRSRWQLRRRIAPWGIGLRPWLLGGIALTAAIATAQNPDLVDLWERNAQTVFFDLRGPVAPPGGNPATPQEAEIVILAMDGDTMTQGTQIYPSDPKQYAYFAPIQQWPWQRTAYAIVIDRLMQAGARAVVLDVVLDASSSYGDADDEELRRVLQKYPGRVTLAAKYVEEEKRTGFELQLLTPNPIFQSVNPLLGFINLPISANGRMHELGDRYFQQMQQSYTAQGITVPRVPSLATGALQAAQIKYPTPTSQDIFFYGPSQTFRHIPFWHVLDPQNWQGYHLKNRTFKDKIVLIGPTGGGETFQDFHAAPFSSTLRYPEKLAGVEIQANAIATLMQGRTLIPVFTNRGLQALFVASLVLAAAYVQSRRDHQLTLSRLLHRFGYGMAIALGYGMFSYVVFVQGRFILPTAVPMLAIVISSTASVGAAILRYQRTLRREVGRLPDMSTLDGPETAFETPDLQEAEQEWRKEIIGRTLDGRYRIEQQIGEGGFGQTYRAVDLKRPSSPLCVVKRLRPQNRRPNVVKLAEVLFQREAEVLDKLKHAQIPELLAYFSENNEFYLVQQYVDGHSLAEELTLHSTTRKITRPLSEQAVVMILYELLHILAFVHQQGVIHRDIKPANIMRRHSDGKLVLIDFGAVKQVRELVDVLEDGRTEFTVPIGTNGYMAPEQAQGKPHAASDIYALGMTGIRALTGIEPRNIDTNQAGESQGVNWRETVRISEPLMQILENMTRIDVSDRYQTAQAVLVDLQPRVEMAQKSGYQPQSFERPMTVDDDRSAADETQHWHPDLPDLPLPPTDPEQLQTDAFNLDETQVWHTQQTPPPDSDIPPTAAKTP